MSGFYGTISRPIPIDERERVFVDKFGPGLTVERLSQGGTITGVGVRLDNGETVLAAPREVWPYVDFGASNVVQFPSRVVVS